MNLLINNFKSFIKNHGLFEPDERILLAVSGGVDSVVMAYLFHRAGFKFGIAHCNFQLRGNDSIADENFVNDLAKRLEVSFYSKKFETASFADDNKLSIQMAARDLRYEWFNEVLKENNFKYLATAHHKNDLAETVLLNLVKGSVLNGLHGILPKTGHVIRPFLFADKEEIMAFASYQKIIYLEDKSNAENKYQRNLIRNEVIPLLNKINPGLADTIYQTSNRRFQLEKWIEKYASDTWKKIVKQSDNGISLLISDIEKYMVPPEILFQWVAEYGFNYTQVAEMFSNLQSTESLVFKANKEFPKGETESYMMLKDRKEITIVHSGDEDSVEVNINENDQKANYKNKHFKIEKIDPSSNMDFKDPLNAYLDEMHVTYPLTIRRWTNGDSFHPFGLKGSKLVSDFLTDLKLPRLEKNDQLVICSAEKICWVVGQRIDDRFKITARTQKILKISLEMDNV